MDITYTEEDLQEMEDNYGGLCLACGEITYGGVEPDARNYHCEECGERQVFGPHWLIIEWPEMFRIG